eukprot:gene18305-31367_t
MSRNGYREVAAIANCLLCDTYFMLVVGVAPRAAELRGRKGTKILEEHLSKMQDKLPSYKSVFCPTCVELMARQSWQEWIAGYGRRSGGGNNGLKPASEAGDREADDGEADDGEAGDADGCEFSVCRLPSFAPEEGEQAPLYLNAADATAKPKWTLAQGLGPPALELDKSHSGRIYKPTLRPFDVKIEPFYPPKEGKAGGRGGGGGGGSKGKSRGGGKSRNGAYGETSVLGGDSHASVALAYDRYLHTFSNADLDATLAEWFEARPLYTQWTHMKAAIEQALVAEGVANMEL